MNAPVLDSGLLPKRPRSDSSDQEFWKDSVLSPGVGPVSLVLPHPELLESTRHGSMVDYWHVLKHSYCLPLLSCPCSLTLCCVWLRA